MPAYRFYNPAPVFPDLLGIEPVSGGSLTFYDLGTTDLRTTWSDDGLAIPNSNPVVLDSAGRANTNIFLNGNYTVVLKDALGATIWTRDVIPGGDTALTIPALSGETGKFLTNDGVNLLWEDVRQMPDATGSTGQVPVTDGAGYVLTDLPEPEPPVDPDIVVDGTAKTFLAGVTDDETKYFVQCGSGSAPASGSENTQVSVTFPVPFDALWHINITQTHNGVTALGTVPSLTLTASSPTGFTVRFSTDENSDFSGWNITSPVPFTYEAKGTREVA
ncbi:hypothetical protein [Pseudoxanthomonas dokdonensis]|uniref:Uncharacterized protein n=1 Tax=Pseudoxanthomonas dokdonensis TaxID=344882 RepID=A0A0R0CTR0_9GAMM|nr:hypothetical protein [Pseudoxanthomonas dokdonensis]KRG69121.1 hypothetical protein ABB29_11950 [Pseudoxanthomonas dokdonensis]